MLRRPALQAAQSTMPETAGSRETAKWVQFALPQLLPTSLIFPQKKLFLLSLCMALTNIKFLVDKFKGICTLKGAC